MKEKKLETKNFWKSKTLWINAALIIGEILVNLGTDLSSGGAVSAISLVNMILRVISKHKLK